MGGTLGWVCLRKKNFFKHKIHCTNIVIDEIELILSQLISAISKKGIIELGTV